MILNETKKTISEFLQNTYSLENTDFQVISARNLEDGDFFTNVCLKYSKNVNLEPLVLAQQIKTYLESTELNKYFNIEIKHPGFLNFYLSTDYFSTILFDKNKLLISTQFNLGKLTILEYLSPNTNKPLHIGHVRNLAIGTSLANILESSGSSVKKAIIFNDRGLHIMKSVWGYLFYACKNPDNHQNWVEKITDWQKSVDKWFLPADMSDGTLKKSDHFVGHWYVVAESSNITTKEQDWSEMLQAWESKSDVNHQSIRNLWDHLNKLFYDGFWESARNFEISFDDDHVSHESEIYEKGRDIILSNLDNGTFVKLPDNAIQVDLSKYKLPDKILVRKDGTAIYMTFDIELTRQRTLLGADKLIWVVGSDQDLYFKQLFATCELLGYGKISSYRHYSYGMVALPEGKMSSRKGTVIYADDLYSLVEENVHKIMSSSYISKDLSDDERNDIVHSVSLGALRWTMLCYEPQTKILFDLTKSISIDGFSGPYVQYTHARCCSVLARVQSNSEYNIKDLNSDELNLLRVLCKYPEELDRSVVEMAPHYICHYLFNLSQAFNTFYNSNRIISSPNEAFRIALTDATAQVLKNGLNLLGIHAPVKM